MKGVVRCATSIDTSLHNAFLKNPKTLGRIYAVISSFFGFLNPFFVQLSGEKNTIRVMIFRGIILSMTSWAVIQASEHPRTVVHKSIIYKLIFRGMLAVTMFFIFYWALNYMNLQIALTLFQTSPSITYILAILAGQESLTKERTLALIGILAGLSLIISPGLLFFSFDLPKDQENGSMYLLAVGMVLFSAFLKAVVNLLLKTMKENDPMINNLYTSSTNLTLCGFAFIITKTHFDVTLRNFFLFSLNGITTFFMVTYNFKAIQYEDTSVVAVIGSLPILYSFLVNVLFLGTVPEVGAVIGSLMVLVFMAVMTLGGKGKPPPTDSKVANPVPLVNAT
jgi:drug/metabolite transporter (DMT)-like permease